MTNKRLRNTGISSNMHECGYKFIIDPQSIHPFTHPCIAKCQHVQTTTELTLLNGAPNGRESPFVKTSNQVSQTEGLTAHI